MSRDAVNDLVLRTTRGLENELVYNTHINGMDNVLSHPVPFRSIESTQYSLVKTAKMGFGIYTGFIIESYVLRDKIRQKMTSSNLVLSPLILLKALGLFPLLRHAPETYLVHPIREKRLINRQLPERQQQHSRLAPRFSHVMSDGRYPRWNLTGVPKNIWRSVHGVDWGIPLSLCNVM